MSETTRFALIIALTSAAVLAAVLVNRLTARLRIPAPVLDAGRCRYRRAGCSWNADAAGRHGPAGRRGCADSDLVQRRQAHRLGSAPPRSRTDHCRRGSRGTFLTAAAGSLLLHAALDWRGISLCWSRLPSRRPTSGVLGPRETGDRWARHDLGGRIRSERPSRDRADGWAPGCWRSRGVAFGRVAADFVLQMTIGVAAAHCGRCRLLWRMAGSRFRARPCTAANARERPASTA